MSRAPILITGASSYVGAHVLKQFLSEGTPVRGVVRSQSSADRVLKVNGEYASLLKFAIVPDITAPCAFDEAVQGVEGVIHIASPFTANIQDREKEMLIPAIEGTKQVLESVYKCAPQVKRVVMTASFASIVDVSKGLRDGYVYDEKDFNPATYEEAKSEETSPVFAYCASKALAEKAAWKFVDEKKPHFSLTVINPPVIYGPNLHYIDDLNKLNTSSAMFYSLMNGSRTEVPPTAFWAIVDVRDVALAHKRAYYKPEAGGQRYLTTWGRFSFQQICDILREEFPELRDRVPVGNPGEPITGVYNVDNSKVKRELGIEFIPLRQIVVDTAKNFLEIEKRLATTKELRN
ncbi:NAD(P)-binding protein [Trichoderma citrinoviride]|uniref:NAD(P)-binding protein n=1 Tax=Trichoderma citrinoviride TaxID=58853 RepID=A0A2T4B095_9HYPO|nr:NAD(P)-binding protein [Trichoderma citrinoviride]PTB62742.1 NAD(P)-binding protein [Trichoderma citrinoviride]